MPYYFHFKSKIPGQERNWAVELASAECDYGNGHECKNEVTLGLDLCHVHRKEKYGVEVRKSTIPGAGDGLFATRRLKKYDWVPYCGERTQPVVDNARYGKFNSKKKGKKAATAPYAILLRPGQIEDAARIRGLGALVNHKEVVSYARRLQERTFFHHWEIQDKIDEGRRKRTAANKVSEKKRTARQDLDAEWDTDDETFEQNEQDDEDETDFPDYDDDRNPNSLLYHKVIEGAHYGGKAVMSGIVMFARDIEAGEELFVTYGNDYTLNEPLVESYTRELSKAPAPLIDWMRPDAEALRASALKDFEKTEIVASPKVITRVIEHTQIESDSDAVPFEDDYVPNRGLDEVAAPSHKRAREVFDIDAEEFDQVERDYGPTVSQPIGRINFINNTLQQVDIYDNDLVVIDSSDWAHRRHEISHREDDDSARLYERLLMKHT